MNNKTVRDVLVEFNNEVDKSANIFGTGAYLQKREEIYKQAESEIRAIIRIEFIAELREKHNDGRRM